MVSLALPFTQALYIETSSSASLGVEFQLQRLCYTIQLLAEQIQTVNAVSAQGTAFNHQITELRGSGQKTNALEHVESRPNPATDGSSLASIVRFGERSTLAGGNNNYEQPLYLASSSPAILRHTAYSINCVCACHFRNRLRSPDILEPILGSLIVGVNGSSGSLQRCNVKQCRESTTQITYAFPQWLMKRVISVNMAYSYSRGPDLCLRMMRVRPKGANIFAAVFRGTRDHVQRLLGDNDASVLDIDPAHNTALMVRSLWGFQS